MSNSRRFERFGPPVTGEGLVTGVNYNPKTRPVPAISVRRGNVVMESDGHPVLVDKVTVSKGHIYIYCRYVWQRSTEQLWVMRPMPLDATVHRAVRR